MQPLRYVMLYLMLIGLGVMILCHMITERHEAQIVHHSAGVRSHIKQIIICSSSYSVRHSEVIEIRRKVTRSGRTSNSSLQL